MRNVLKIALFASTVLLVHGETALAGPISALYLTSGDQQEIEVIQGSSVVNRFKEVHNADHEYPIAVNTSLRTTGDTAGRTGAEYSPGGVTTGTTYTLPMPINLAFDGTTDGSHNYTVDVSSGGIYQLTDAWTQPLLLFSTRSPHLGSITYDPFNNSLWVGGRIDGELSDYTLDGALLSSFQTLIPEITSLAMDHADGTLWFGTQRDLGGTRTLYQFSTAGIELGTEQFTALANDNYLGGEFAATPVPQPATLLLLGTGLFGLGLMRWRKAA